MKTESGPLKYRLARKHVQLSSMERSYDIYILQGWFEWSEADDQGDGYLLKGEWRDLETVDIE